MAREVFDGSCVYKNELERTTKHPKVEEAEERCAVELLILGRKTNRSKLTSQGLRASEH